MTKYYHLFFINKLFSQLLQLLKKRKKIKKLTEDMKNRKILISIEIKKLRK